MLQFRPTVAEINLDHLSHNIDLIRTVVNNNRFFCPMVKANAYGHGSIEVSRLLEKKGVTQLGVCILEEAFELISSGIKSNLFVFQSIDVKGLEALFEKNLETLSHPLSRGPFFQQIIPVVSSMDQLEWTIDFVKAFKMRTPSLGPFQIHLKFDTGMNRFGLRIESIDTIIQKIKGEPDIQLTGVCSHLLQGEDLGEESGRTLEQIIQVKMIQNRILNLLGADSRIDFHLFNSPAIGRILTQSHFDDSTIGLRPGLMIYGYSSLPSESFNLKPVMTLKSTVSHFRRLNPGETVSYGGTWKAQKPSIIAVVPLGYADGVRRGLSNKSEVLISGMKAPIIGSVCMDSLMVDVSHIKDRIPLDHPQDVEVVLWGYSKSQKFLSAGEKARDLQTHIWEILTSPSYRVPRVYVGGFV